MIKRFLNIGDLGIINDPDEYDIPDDAWTDAQNIRFHNGYAQKFEGHSVAYDPPTVAPYWVLPVPTTSLYYWIYAGLDKVYLTDGTTHGNITRQSGGGDQDFTGNSANLWTGGLISGIPVITNGVDAPQMFTPVAGTTDLAPLTYSSGVTWEDQGYTAKVIRPFREFLLALYTVEGGTDFPHKMRWSTSAAAGAVPLTWDEADASEDAGFTNFGESAGNLVDCLPLRNNNMVYSTDSTWSMAYIGGNDVFSFQQIFKTSGLLSTNCVSEIYGRHVCLTTGDVVAHDGANIESIINRRMQRWLFNQLDSDNYDQSFTVPNYAKNELWLCFPSTGSTFCDLALVWNYQENSFAVRELPNTPYIGYGIIDPSENTTWDADADTWDTDSGAWNQRAFNPTENKLLITDPTNTKLFQADNTNQFNGSSFTSYVEKTGIDLDDPTTIKRIARIYPRVDSNVALTVKVGFEYTKGEGYTWTTYSYDPTTDDKLDVRVTGRFFGIRFESDTDTAWNVHSFDIEYQPVGRR